MFTWICPKCGKEVPPHENECPFCHGSGVVQEPARQSAPAPPPPPPMSAPPPPPVQGQPQYAPAAAPPPPPTQQYYEIGSPPRSMPGWLVTLIVAAVVTGGAYLAYRYLLPSNRSASSAVTEESPFEAVPAAQPETDVAKPVSGRLSRHIEVTGFRITEDAQKRAGITFLVVNHSAADIGDLAGKVRLRTTESKPGDDPISEFEFKTTRLGPFESVEFKTTMSTKLRAYELPDWQFLTADVEITSPQELR